MTNDRSRRQFFRTAAAAAAWTTFGRLPGLDTAALAATPSKALKLGVASYSMREFTLDQALEMAKTLGVTRMTFKDVHVPRTDPPEATRALRAKIEAAGITIMGGGTITIPNDAAKIEKEFVYAKNAGFPLIYVDPEPAALDTIERLARSYDIKVAIHNHGPEDKHFPTPQSVLEVVRKMDKRCGLCMDIGHSARTGVDVVKTIAEAGDRLFDMHVKDLSDPMNRDSQVEVGRGVFDFPRLFRALIEIGYAGQVGLEYEIKEDDPLPGMIESIAYMRGVLAALR